MPAEDAEIARACVCVCVSVCVMRKRHRGRASDYGNVPAGVMLFQGLEIRRLRVKP